MSVWDRMPASRSTELVRRRLASGAGAASWLLLGGRGAPVYELAIATAAAALCRLEPQVGCGQCSDCRRISRRGHPDVHHVVPEGAFIRVETIRENVIPEVMRSPFEGGAKVFIIEQADRMNPAAQNALLKTLEEPPPDTYLLLISEREDELLDTIRSRCLVVRVDSVVPATVREMLEQEGASPGQAELAVQLAPDDLRRARELALDDSARLRRSLWLSVPGRLWVPADAVDLAAEIVSEVRDAVRVREAEHKKDLARVVEAMGDARGSASIRTALANRYKRQLKRIEESMLIEALDTLASLYRDVLLIKSGGLESVLNSDKQELLREWAESPTVSAAGLSSMVERCAQAAEALTKNANATLTLEALLLDALRLVPPPPGLAAA